MIYINKYLDQDSLDENALADAQVDLQSFNIDSNDGFHDFDEDNLEEAGEEELNPYQDNIFTNPLFNTFSRYNVDDQSTQPEYATLTTTTTTQQDSDDLSQSQIIRNCEELENAMIAPTTFLYLSDCFKCKSPVISGKYIICSQCLNNIHYACNNPKVTIYYQKTPKNFKCDICKPIK